MINTLMRGFAITVWLIQPFWIVHFYRFGSPFEEKFISNHYHYPTAEILDTTAGLYLSIAVFLMVVVLVHVSKWLGGRARIAVQTSAYAAGFIMYGWITMAVVYRAFLKFMVSVSVMETEAAVAVIMIVGVIVLGGVTVIFRHRVLAFLNRCTVAFGVPLGLMLIANIALAEWQLGFPNSLYFPLAAEDKVKGSAPPAVRVVWMIFDGWDHELTFEKRDPTVTLTNTDRLVSTSFWAKRAISPTPGTLTSVASMMTGRLIVQSTRRQQDFDIQYHGDRKSVPWSAEKTVFSDMREKGRRSAILMHDTQAHPYCRILHDDLSACWEEGWWTGERITALQRIDDFVMIAVAHVVRYWDTSAAFTVPLIKERYERFKEQVLASACNLDYALLYIHWMLPHSPFFYDRHNDSFTPAVWRSYERRYSDNLELVDVTLGDFFKALQQCGADRNTAYIITADHGLNGNKRPVFILKLPRKTAGLIYDETAQLVKLRTIITGIVDGKIKQYQDVKVMFDGD